MLDNFIISAYIIGIFLVIYHHLIYPLLLGLLSKFKIDSFIQRPSIRNRGYLKSQKDSESKCYSIIIPAFNESKYIAEKIRNLSILDYPTDKYEVILLCDGCSDMTYEIAIKTIKEFICSELNCHVVNFSVNQGKVAMLHEGVKKSKFENIVFSDVSALLPVNSLLMLDSHFADISVGAVTGGYRFIEKGTAGEQTYWNYQSMIKSRESNMASVLGAHGAFYAIRKLCYKKLPANIINDDFVIPMNIIKQGYRVVYESRVVAIELEKVSLEQDMQRRLRIAAGNFQQLFYLSSLLLPKYGWNAFNFASGKALRAITPFILLFILMTNFYLALNHIEFMVLFMCQVLMYGMVIAINILGLSIRFFSVKLICYLINGYWVALKGSLRYMCGLQKKVW
tara:strand:- start:3362 stop:4546 length:1185 start_codon:yes stop_codon:yes gene_type:complete